MRARDFLHVQDAWDAYRRNVKNVASDDFWNFFLPMHEQSSAAIKTAISSAKKVFLEEGSLEWNQFPWDRMSLIKFN